MGATITKYNYKGGFQLSGPKQASQTQLQSLITRPSIQISKPQEKTVYWVRHGISCANMIKALFPIAGTYKNPKAILTLQNARGRHAPNSDLSMLGIIQALNAGVYINTTQNQYLTEIRNAVANGNLYSSNMRRAIETAYLMFLSSSSSTPQQPSNYDNETKEEDQEGGNLTLTQTEMQSQNVINVLPYINEQNIAVFRNKDNQPNSINITVNKLRNLENETLNVQFTTNNGSPINNNQPYKDIGSKVSFNEYKQFISGNNSSAPPKVNVSKLLSTILPQIAANTIVIVGHHHSIKKAINGQQSNLPNCSIVKTTYSWQNNTYQPTGSTHIYPTEPNQMQVTIKEPIETTLQLNTYDPNFTTTIKQVAKAEGNSNSKNTPFVNWIFTPCTQSAQKWVKEQYNPTNKQRIGPRPLGSI